ncbi:IgGFc-binding protein [Nannocystis bainbridge]|uniref:IgGFc-binding protein n=1 Tax=Nannocystis bainbridge TaxID=2995303 RepID=A0ABT5DX26_9BACT|nr:IgGFc-binding protein [Nannocystis bainbridge]MDC0718166.1 IgGFc-binding protein [Nannocystis bainbridge]
MLKREDLFKLGVMAAALLPACGDDGTTSASASVTNVTGITNPITTTSTTDSPTSTEGPTTTVATTDGTGSLSDSEGTTVATTTDATTVASDGTSTSTTDTTGPVTATTTSTTDPDTTTVGPCVCNPGDLNGCEGDQILVCTDDCQGFAPEPCPGNGQSCKNGACGSMLCNPGQVVCEGLDAEKTCNGAGDAYDPPVACTETQQCDFGGCTELCDLVQSSPSSIGCSFLGHKMDNFNDGQADSLIVGNTHPSKAAQVQLYFVPNGTNVEQPQGAPINLAPGMTYTYTMSNAALDKKSELRKGGVYRVNSNIPIIAYLHSPLGQQATNDASMLLPEYALRQNYIVASWRDTHNQYPSYFNVIALQDGTTVKWTPPQGTLAGNGVPAVAGGATGQVAMNRFDTLQVRGPQAGSDVSGTFIEADKPIWVIGAVECVNVPTNAVSYCDHIEEQMLPLDYWGKTYVGAHSPKRGTEKHYWRVFAGEDNTTITTDPVQPGTPINLNKGQFKDLVIPNNVSFMFNGDKPFLPVQYLESQNGGANTGDPAMYQMIPVEQFLDRYAFATGTGYTADYVQVIREKGAADVKVDGNIVSGYYAVGNYEVADWKINQGGHLAESEQPFGIISVGYTAVTSYAYPGGMRLKIINPQ